MSKAQAYLTFVCHLCSGVIKVAYMIGVYSIAANGHVPDWCGLILARTVIWYTLSRIQNSANGWDSARRCLQLVVYSTACKIYSRGRKKEPQ